MKFLINQRIFNILKKENDILEPKSLIYGGSFAHNFKFDRYNLKFYFFCLFDNDLDQ